MNREIARIIAKLTAVATAAGTLGRNANYEINGRQAALVNPEWLTEASKTLAGLADELLSLINDSDNS